MQTIILTKITVFWCNTNFLRYEHGILSTTENYIFAYWYIYVWAFSSDTIVQNNGECLNILINDVLRILDLLLYNTTSFKKQKLTSKL